MRELARCLAWTLALGALALLVAMFHGAGLAHTDGPWAWFLLLLFWPHYLLGYGHDASPQSLYLPVVFAAQSGYFLTLVAAVRRLRRGKARWRARWRFNRAPP
jgi:hypothetical protein